MVLMLALSGCSTPNLTGYNWAQLSDGEVFHIGADDVLKVDFFTQKDLSGEVIVRPDGYIDLPLIGEVKVGGKTPDEARVAIVDKMREFEKNPVVTVQFKAVKSYRIYLMGQIQRPGEFQPTRKVTVMQALSLGGGLTSFAEADEILIIRRVGNDEQHIPFVYSLILKGEMSQMNITLASGDTVVVP